MPSEPSILYELPNMMAYHLANGHEIPLNETPSKLTLMMVTTSVVDPFAANPVEVEDFYLHIQMMPNLDLPLPATTRIFRQYPRSYLIPRLDLDGGQGSNFTRIEFPERRNQDDVDTWETIISQCTAFLEKSAPPNVQTGRPNLESKRSTSYTASTSETQFSPQGYHNEKARATTFAPGSTYTPGSGVAAGEQYGYGPSSSRAGGHDETGRLVLVNQADGQIVGELSEGFNVTEQGGFEAGSKAPVEITLPSQPGNKQLLVRPVPPISESSYLEDASHPMYASSSIVSKAAMASKMVVTAATYVASAMESGAQKFTQNTQPVAQPLTFNPTTHERVRKIHTFTTGASSVSSKTLGRATHIAQNIGAKVAGRGEHLGPAERAAKNTNAKPGILNKSMIAFSTIADGVDAASKHLLATSQNAATTMVGHRYGEEAAGVAHGLTGSVRNVGLVYVDATGVSRRALIKGAAKGVILGSVKGGGDVVVTNDNGSSGEIIFPNDRKSSTMPSPSPNRSTTPQPPAYSLPGTQNQSGYYPQGGGKEQHF